MRSRWQISSLTDHLSGTVRRASSGSESPATIRVTSSTCPCSRSTMRACTACLSWGPRANLASSAIVYLRATLSSSIALRGRGARGIIGPMGEAGTGPRPDLHGWMRDAFLRLLGAVYLVAFLSLWVQAEGLIGARGVLPIRELLDLARERMGASRYWVLPTVFWIADGDAALHVVCAAGTLLSLVALLGRARALVMLGLWVLYLSLAVAGEDFLSFQWDALLLEAGLLAAGLGPPRVPRPRPPPPPLPLIWMFPSLLLPP